MIIQETLRLYNEVFGLKTKVKELLQMSSLFYIWLIFIPLSVFIVIKHLIYKNYLAAFLCLIGTLILSFSVGLHRKYLITKHFGSYSMYKRNKKIKFFHLLKIKLGIKEIEKLEMLDELVCKEIENRKEKIPFPFSNLLTQLFAGTLTSGLLAYIVNLLINNRSQHVYLLTEVYLNFIILILGAGSISYLLREYTVPSKLKHISILISEMKFFNTFSNKAIFKNI